MSDGETFDEENPLASDDENDADYTEHEFMVSTPKLQAKPKRKPPTKVEYKWTVAEQEQLIAKVEEFACIYDEGSEQNKDKMRRDSAWRSVAAIFGGSISEAQCRAKWASLRASHRNIEGKLNKYKSGQAASSVQPTWHFYHLMKFVVQCDKRNKMASESNLVNSK